jgi:hypothetical protein
MSEFNENTVKNTTNEKSVVKMLNELEDGESLVLVRPKTDGYYILIGDRYTSISWKVTQSQLNKLAVLTNEYKTKT